MRCLPIALAVAGFTASPALAQGTQDATGVCAMAERHYAAIRAGDMETAIGHHMPEFTFFTADGGLLWSFKSLDHQRTEIREVSTDFTSRTWIRHCRAQVFGSTGIATYYLVGAVTVRGVTSAGTWRVTEVWVRQGSEWKEAHHHESPLLDSVR